MWKNYFLRLFPDQQTSEGVVGISGYLLSHVDRLVDYDETKTCFQVKVKQKDLQSFKLF